MGDLLKIPYKYTRRIRLGDVSEISRNNIVIGLTQPAAGGMYQVKTRIDRVWVLTDRFTEEGAIEELEYVIKQETQDCAELIGTL